MKVSHWLLLRGLGRTTEHWLDFPKKLEAQGYTCVSLDLPGIGSESHKSTPFTISAMTADLRRRMRNHDWTNNNWGVLGVSLGAMVALDWANRHPKDFSKAVVINTSSRDTGEIWQRLSPFGMYKSLEAIFQSGNSKGKEKAILDMVSNLKNKDLKTLGAMEAIARKHPLSLTNFSKQLIAASRFMAPEKIDIPTLLLASIKDHMVDVRCSKQLAERLQQPIKFHPTAGHDIPLDDPDWVIERVVEFDNEIPDSTNTQN